MIGNGDDTVPNRWFVSSVVPKKLRLGAPRTPARQTEIFPTEAEAKRYAKEILLARKNIVAGTLLRGNEPTRRIISGRALDRWLEESKQRP